MTLAAATGLHLVDDTRATQPPCGVVAPAAPGIEACGNLDLSHGLSSHVPTRRCAALRRACFCSSAAKDPRPRRHHARLRVTQARSQSGCAGGLLKGCAAALVLAGSGWRCARASTSRRIAHVMSFDSPWRWTVGQIEGLPETLALPRPMLPAWWPVSQPACWTKPRLRCCARTRQQAARRWWWPWACCSWRCRGWWRSRWRAWSRP